MICCMENFDLTDRLMRRITTKMNQEIRDHLYTDGCHLKGKVEFINIYLEYDDSFADVLEDEFGIRVEKGK